MNKKEEFFWKDRFVKGISLDKTIRITVVKTTELVETARKNHHLSPVATVLLGRALTGAAILAAQLKGEERVRLSIEGDGSIGTITAEANYVGEVRGFVQNPDVTIDSLTSPYFKYFSGFTVSSLLEIEKKSFLVLVKPLLPTKPIISPCLTTS